MNNQIFIRENVIYLDETNLQYIAIPSNHKMIFEFSQSSFLYVTETGMEPKEIAAGMEKRGIIIRGNLGYLRISIGTMEQNRKMVAAFRDLLWK